MINNTNSQNNQDNQDNQANNPPIDSTTDSTTQDTTQGNTQADNMAGDKGNTLSTGYDTTELRKYLDDNDFNSQQQDIVLQIIDQLVPHLASEMVEGFKQDNHLQRLEQHFGDPKRWQVIRSQLKKWGQANLDPTTYNALASSFDGILSMHKLMNGDSDTNTLKTGNSQDSTLDEEQLLQMMKDPKYWKTKDPQFIAKVKAGFQKVYD